LQNNHQSIAASMTASALLFSGASNPREGLGKNLTLAKGRKVKDAVFAKKRGLTVIDMAKSAWVYKMPRNFRAGIEAGISTLKRACGLDRCTWSRWGGFKQYVWNSIVSYNLLVLARTRLAEA
jgi:transposase, IS5 family